MEYKIVFFDVDGTSTNHVDRRIPYSTIEAISTLKNKGQVKFSIRKVSHLNEQLYFYEKPSLLEKKDNYGYN